jgi:serine protease Do
MSDNQLSELIERYLNGDMSHEEKLRFEAMCADPAISNKLTAHVEFNSMIRQYGERVELEKRLNAIHQEIDVHTLTEQLTERPSWIVQLWHNHHSKISVAASIAVFAILSTLYATGYFNKNTSNYTALRREVDGYKRTTEKLNQSTNALIHEVKASSKRVLGQSKYGGTGFALTNNGYIVTNYHVVNGGDSIYVQNSAGESYHAKLIYTEPQYDIAILKIDDAAFKNLSAVPYNFKKTQSDLGEDVYTVGYPSDSIVLGKGYLSSASGYNGDTLKYRVSIPVNPGNSGGPLLDNKGNVIGIISGKQTQMDGAAFAVKTNYLMQAIKNIPADSITRKINNKNGLAGLSRTQQIKKLQNYVFMVKVYN